MKRLIATLLAAAMCFSLGVSAFAAENTAERAYEGMTTEEMYAQASLFARARGIEILASCVIEVKIAVEMIRQKKKHKC